MSAPKRPVSTRGWRARANATKRANNRSPSAGCAALENPGLYRTDPTDAWRRLKGLGRLRAREQAAARALAEWREAGVLIQDDTPSIYGLRQRFTAPDGAELVREAFFAALHLEDYERRIVLPHERTMTGPKADRLKLLRATGTNLSSIFLLYEDPDDKLAATLAPAFQPP